jgi:sortase A
MKMAVPRTSVRRLLSWSQILLLTAGVAMLGYCAFVLADTWFYQKQASRLFDREHMQSTMPPVPGAGATNGLLGRMEIPRLGISVIVAEGTTEATLRRAGGHIAGTALPGEAGNIGIAGHRDTLFRPLRNIRQNDVITLTTLEGEYCYRVVSTKIVSPADVTVLDSDGHEVLTLVTCYPFYFVGPAPDRFIVRAERVTGST